MWVGFGWIDVSEEGEEGAVLVIDDSPTKKTIKTSPEKAAKRATKKNPKKTEAELREAHLAALNSISDRVDAACRAAGHAEQKVIFSNYPLDKDETPVDNLDRVAVRGRVIIGYQSFSSEDAYVSPTLLDPTWLTLCVYANAAIESTGDYHHVFFEGLRGSKTHKGVKMRFLVMGS